MVVTKVDWSAVMKDSYWAVRWVELMAVTTVVTKVGGMDTQLAVSMAPMWDILQAD